MRAGDLNIPIAVSVVVPVYNAALYIYDTLASLLLQGELIGEILVVDDDSRDSTREIITDMAKVDCRIKLFCFSSNKGVSAARNFGIQESSGDWILFFDGDDIADAKLLERQLHCIRHLTHNGYGDIVLAHTAYQQIDETGNAIGGITRWKQVEPQEILGYFLLRNHIITASGVLARRAALVDVGGFNQDLRYSEDWDLWLRLAQQGGFCYVDEPLVYVRRHGNNASRSIATMLEGEKMALSQYGMEFIRNAIFQRNLPWEINAADYSSLLFRMDQWDQGYRVLQDALSRAPSFAAGQFLLGLYYVKRKEWCKAQKCFEHTILLDERHGAAMNNLGVILALSGQVDKSICYFHRAMEFFPGYLDAKRNREFVLQCQEKPCTLDRLHITWRELRPVLLSYSE